MLIEHIGWKEFIVVLILINEWIEKLKNKKIVIIIEIQVTVSYLKKAREEKSIEFN